MFETVVSKYLMDTSDGYPNRLLAALSHFASLPRCGVSVRGVLILYLADLRRDRLARCAFP
jgi:hypothetical protein